MQPFFQPDYVDEIRKTTNIFFFIFVIISSPVIDDDPDYENEIDKDFDEDIEA